MQTRETSWLLLKASSRMEMETETVRIDVPRQEAAPALPENFHLWLVARSAEARAFVQQATDHTVREDLLRLAEDYDEIARQTAPRREAEAREL
jgi:hypothetical protein